MLAVHHMAVNPLDFPQRKRSLSSISSDESDAATNERQHCSAVTRSHTFYFADGDVILSAGCTRFKVHSNVLALSSPVFQTLISEAAFMSDSDSEAPADKRQRQSLMAQRRRSSASSANSSTRKQLVYFRVAQDAKTIHLLLTFLYPFIHSCVDSTNVSTLLRTATAFQITHLITQCIEHLELSLSLHPLLVFYLAERNILNAPQETQDRLQRVYRSASRIVLDDLPHFARKASFQRLTRRTRTRLLAKWASYLRQLYCLKTSMTLKYPHSCQSHDASFTNQQQLSSFKACEDHTNAVIHAALVHVISRSDGSSPTTHDPPCPSSIVRLFIQGQGIEALKDSPCAPAIRNAMKAVVSRTFGKDALEEWRYLAIDLDL